jgi:hypothetical protein
MNECPFVVCCVTLLMEVDGHKAIIKEKRVHRRRHENHTDGEWNPFWCIVEVKPPFKTALTSAYPPVHSSIVVLNLALCLIAPIQFDACLLWIYAHPLWNCSHCLLHSLVVCELGL